MADPSFDIASKIDWQEIVNAVNQTERDIANRYDLKDSGATIEQKQADSKIFIEAPDDYKVNAIYELFVQKLIKRGISAKAVKAGEIKSALGGRAKMEITVQQGISKEKAKEITKDVKDSGLKVQTQIQDDQIRVSGKKIDDLQAVMKVLKAKDYDIHIDFINYR
ncbi:MAG: YajQ family cyclic di-GMP-binding protein [Candidatus Margulisiibacteriota bacterium]